ncbi:MAG TPA: tetratricopeptide repeat protein, partial [Spirochaetes bacterium]|nr:tetratricopeptide repeat protein [Spirochaetota bacterium]
VLAATILVSVIVVSDALAAPKAPKKAAVKAPVVVKNDPDPADKTDLPKSGDDSGDIGAAREDAAREKAVNERYRMDAEMNRIRRHFLDGRLKDLESALMSYAQKYDVAADREYHFYMGFSQESRGDYRKAVESYLRAIEINPGYARARNSLGNLYCRLRKYHFALPHYKKALEINGYNPFIHYNIGSLYFETGDLDNALPHLLKAVEYKRNYGNAYHKLGVLMFMKKQYLQAIGYFNHAVSFNTEFHSTHYYVGLSYYFLEKGSLAITSLKKALRMKPDFFEAALELGKVHHSYGEFTYALEYYKKANAINPDYHDLKLRMVECYRELKRYQEAIALVRALAAREPENELLQRYLKNLQERRLMENLDNPYDLYSY